MNGLFNHLNLNLSLWWWFLGNDIFIKTILDYAKGLEKLTADGMNKREDASQPLFLDIRDSSPPLPLPGLQKQVTMAVAGVHVRKTECGSKQALWASLQGLARIQPLATDYEILQQPESCSSLVP